MVLKVFTDQYPNANTLLFKCQIIKPLCSTSYAIIFLNSLQWEDNTTPTKHDNLQSLQQTLMTSTPQSLKDMSFWKSMVTK